MMMSHQNNEYSAELKTFLTENFNGKFNDSSSNFNNFDHINLTDSNGFNLLMMAIDKGQSLSLIDELLRLPFDINDKSSDGQTAADIAWQRKNYEILLKLLEANSTFPSDFYSDELETDDDDASEKIIEFINISLKMHTAVINNNINEITELIKSKPNLRYFYNLSNISAATTALNFKNHQIYEILTSNDCSIGPHEDFHELLEKVQYEPDTKRRKLAQISDIHSAHSKNILERHLMIHYANIVVAHDDRFVKQRIKHVKESFKVLNEIPLTRNILQLTTMHKNFKIHFDFNRTSVEFMNPFSGDQFTRGVCEDFKFKKFHLFVAAKELLSDDKCAAIGTLAHELCHFAMTLVFHNDGKPYDVDDGESEMKFKEIIEKFKNENEEKIIESVYNCYGEVLWPAELIVRVPHITAAYHNDSNKLNELKITFNELFDYYDDVVAPKIIETQKMLEKLFNNSVDIDFNDLTDAYKAKIHHSNVNFQGIDVKFNEIIEDKNSEIFQLLKSKQIRGFLLESSSLIIGYAEEINTEFYIERDFIDHDVKANINSVQWIEELNKSVWNDEIKENIKNFERILSIADESTMILLSDRAGAGKTTTFKHLSIKLKGNFPNHWISYIDLKRYLKVYEKFENNFDVLEILIEILDIDCEIDAEIFKKLFNSNKVILLYDGVDEISPKFKDLFIKLIESVKNSTANQQWIATRPQHTQELSSKFNQNAYKLLIYSYHQQVELISNVLKNHNIPDNASDLFSQIKDLLDIEIDNPLILRMIIELYIEDKTIMTYYNTQKLYENIIDIKIRKICEKGEIVNENRDNRKSELTIWHVHQIYALKLLYKDGFEDHLNNNKKININEFQLLKRWKKEQSKWTPEAISRYGFLIVDHWNTENEFPDFIHRTFAEFFVAQFTSQKLFDDEFLSDSEIELRVKMIISIIFGDNDSFINSFIENQESQEFNDKFLEIATSDKMQELINWNLTEEFSFYFLKFFCIEKRFLRAFKFNDGMTVFQKFYTIVEDEKFYLNDILMIVTLYETSLGAEWIRHTGYAINDFSLPNDKVIDEHFLSQSIKDGEETLHFRKRDSKLFYQLLCFFERAEICQNVHLRFFSNHPYELIEISLTNSLLTEKFIEFVRNQFSNCKEKIDEILIHNLFNMHLMFKYEKTFESSEEYFLNVRKFFVNFGEFLSSNRTIFPNYFKYFELKIFIIFCGLKYIKNLYEKHQFYTHNEIQEFLIQNSVPIIFRMYYFHRFELLDSLEEFFKENFQNKIQLRRFLEHRFNDKVYLDIYGHTVFSFIKNKIENCEDEKILERLRETKEFLKNLAEKCELMDEEIENLEAF